MNFWILVLALFLEASVVLFSQNTQKPKNIIILIGDGMGISYVSTSILQSPDSPFRRFTTTGFSVTCSADNLITDSAAGATALSTGYRTKNHYVGVDTIGNTITNIFEVAEKINLSTGLVVTSTVTHATPAAFVSHVISRNEETKIANQFLDIDLDVVIGGGAKYFFQYDSIKGCTHFDELKSKQYTIFQSADELTACIPDNKFYALLELESFKKANERNYSLAELTYKAIQFLSKNENGFVLMVEGSQIDWAGHNNNPEEALVEMNDFSQAISVSLDFAENNEETLVLVTADHETGGLALTEGKIDGSELSLKFVTKHHTAEVVGVFAFGPGSEQFNGINDNYIIGRKLIQLINPYFNFS
ncbi:MAG: alkaline phosphatase [Ignavibacteriaceae bacterium]|nr:alkaline phosphatase [Ignavibacteriaceae bacterium]